MRLLFIAAIVVILASTAMAAEPQLLSGGATPSSDTAYVFTVTYKGNTTASAVSVVVNNVSFPMQELDPQDTNLADGKIYYVEADLDSGVNTYSFNCVDANGASNTTAAKMLIVKEEPWLQLTHLDVMLSVLIFVPFVIYFIYLARKMTKTLERIEKRENGRENKDETKKNG